MEKRMNVVFLSLAQVSDINAHGIYSDLLRKFRNEGHHVFVVCPCNQSQIHTSYEEKNGVVYLLVKTMDIQKTNPLKKGIGILLYERQFKQAVKRHLNGVEFDLILYVTPPITLAGVVKYLKEKNPKALSYLMLKDIFPQNAVDIGMLSKKSPIYWYFRMKERQLYRQSDFIGCMSPANVEYIRSHEWYYPKEHVEVAPNSIELQDEGDVMSKDILRKYGIPTHVPIFVYGGNLGKPQGIDYLIRCLDKNRNRQDCFFLVIGSGTEYSKLKQWFSRNTLNNMKLMRGLPKKDYDQIVSCCDVGLIFLDYRFTIPNYPSRLLSYLEHKIPVICATDVCTDIGRIAETNGYGYWCESVRPEDFTALVDKMLCADRKQMGERGFQFLKRNYLVEHTYELVVRHFSKM